MNETTTETIEWHSIPDTIPEEAVTVLIKHDGEILPVMPAVYTTKGFLSMWGHIYNPTHWACMPKGPQ
jgi:hypothetical protein